MPETRRRRRRRKRKRCSRCFLWFDKGFQLCKPL